jgi:hypothetical protein
MADTAGHAAVNFRMRPEFAEVVDQLAKRRGLNRSAFLRALLAEECVRLAEKERDGA